MHPELHKEYDADWTIVINYEQFVKAITEHFDQFQKLPELISFDHDLGNEHYKDAFASHIDYDSYSEKTGYHCAKFLVDFCLDRALDPPPFLVHSMNVTGVENIRSLLQNYRKFCESQRASQDT
jgi:hypothetical protein